MRAAITIAFAACLGAAPPARAGGGSGCVASPGQGRVIVGVTLTGLFDRDLVRLVKLGLEGRIRIDTELVRPRRFWFDQRVVSDSRQMVVSYVKARDRFLADGRVVDPERLDIERTSLWLGSRVLVAGDEIRVRARLEVVTVQSLGKVAAWIAPGRRGDDASPSRSAISRALLDTLAEGLVRTTTARCPAAGSV